MALTLASLSNHAPLISPAFATFISILYMAIYVGILYINPISRPSPSINTDAPHIISMRIRLASVSTLTCVTITSFIVYNAFDGKARWMDVLTMLGLEPDARIIYRIYIVVKLIGTLFLGPIVEYFILESGWRDWRQDVRTIFQTWIGWKRFLAGPLTEEIVFRSCVIPLHLMAGRSPAWVIFVTPMYFGFAHLHHLYEWVLHNPDRPLIRGIFISVFQFGFTTLFGWLAAFSFLKSESVWAVFLAHAMCNWLGLPRLYGMVGRSQFKTAIYYVCLLYGVYSFQGQVRYWTKTGLVGL